MFYQVENWIDLSPAKEVDSTEETEDMELLSKPMKGETDQQAGQGTKQSIAKDSMLSFLPPSGHVAPQALLKLKTAKSLFFQSLEVFLLGLVRRLHEAESEENCLNRQYLIMLEVPKVLASLDKKMNPNGGDFLELSNIHSYLFALLCQWNSHVFYGTGMALESFGSYLTSILNPPPFQICDNCGWRTCKCRGKIDKVSFGYFRCEKCHWMECKCKLFETSSKIRFGFRINRGILNSFNVQSSVRAGAGEIDSKCVSNLKPTSSRESNYEDSSLKGMKHIMTFAKQNCRRCFVTHTPLKRWCDKVNKINKNNKMEKHKIIDPLKFPCTKIKSLTTKLHGKRRSCSSIDSELGLVSRW